MLTDRNYEFSKEEEEEEGGRRSADCMAFIKTHSLWIFVLLCTLLNLMIVAFNTRGVKSPSTAAEALAMAAQGETQAYYPLLNSYVGLKDLNRHLDKERERTLSISTYPLSIIPFGPRISSSAEATISLEFMAKNVGTISPRVKHFLLEPHVHSIVQFRAVDYGMENCHLELKLNNEYIGLSMKLGWPVDAHISVWRVDDRQERLMTNEISWTSRRPTRIEKVARWPIGNAADTSTTYSTGNFTCPWGTYHTFELACEEEACLIDFLNDPAQDVPGLKLIQLSSLV